MRASISQGVCGRVYLGGCAVGLPHGKNPVAALQDLNHSINCILNRAVLEGQMGLKGRGGEKMAPTQLLKKPEQSSQPACL